MHSGGLQPSLARFAATAQRLGGRAGHRCCNTAPQGYALLAACPLLSLVASTVPEQETHTPEYWQTDDLSREYAFGKVLQTSQTLCEQHSSSPSPFLDRAPKSRNVHV